MSKVLKAKHAWSDKHPLQFGVEHLDELPESRTNPVNSLDADLNESVEPEISSQMLGAKILEEAHQQAEIMREEAFKEGFQAGQEAGEAAFSESVAQCTVAIENAAQAMMDARQDFLDNLKPQVLELVKHMVARIVQCEPKDDDGLVLRSVEKALEVLSNQQSVTIRLHPQDLEAIKAHQLKLLEQFDHIEHILIEKDDSMPPGGCIVDSPVMQVDARISTLLEHALEALDEQP